MKRRFEATKRRFVFLNRRFIFAKRRVGECHLEQRLRTLLRKGFQRPTDNRDFQSEHQLQDIQLLNSEKEIVLRRKGRSLSSHKRDASALSRL